MRALRKRAGQLNIATDEGVSRDRHALVSEHSHKMRSPSGAVVEKAINRKNCDLPLLPQTIRPSSLAATRDSGHL